MRLLSNGKRVSGSTKTSNKTLARKIYEAKKVDCIRGQERISKAKAVRFPVLCEMFLKWSACNKRSYGRDVILCR